MRHKREQRFLNDKGQTRNSTISKDNSRVILKTPNAGKKTNQIKRKKATRSLTFGTKKKFNNKFIILTFKCLKLNVKEFIMRMEMIYHLFSNKFNKDMCKNYQIFYFHETSFFSSFDRKIKYFKYIATINYRSSLVKRYLPIIGLEQNY